MEIQCIVLSEDQQKQAQACGWIPDDLYFVPERCIFFGGMTEQKQLAALAIYSGSAGIPGEMELVYVCTARAWRGNGVGIRLLEMAEQQLCKQGVQRIRCGWQGTEAELVRTAAYLEQIGYAPATEISHVCICPHEYFQNSSLNRLKEAQAEKWQSVVEIHDYYDHRLKKLLKKHETTGFYIEEDEFVPELCRFYMEDGEIRGAICMRYRRDGSLTSMKGYLSPDLKYKYAMTLMIAVLIYEAKHVAKPGSRVYLKIYRKGFYESVKKLFGEIPEEWFFQEYEKKTGGK